MAALGLLGLLAATSPLAAGQRFPTTWDPTGHPVWHTPGYMRGTPVVAGEALFTITKDHYLLKVAVADGSEIWRAPTGEEGSSYGSRLAYAAPHVLVGEHDLVAFDEVTGRPRWTYRPSRGQAFGAYMGEVHDGLVVAGSGTGELAAVDTRTGRERWLRVLATDGFVLCPRVAGREVIAGVNARQEERAGSVVSLGLDDGHERWRFQVPGEGVGTNITGSPIVAESLVVASSADGRIWGIDRDTGRQVWVLPPIAGPLDSVVPPSDRDFRPLGVTGRTLVAGSVTGYVTGFDLDTRQESWRFAGGQLGSTGFDMVMGHGAVYLPYFSGFLVALDAATGQLRWWTSDWQQGFFWVPAVHGSRLLAASTRGLWALPSVKEEP